MVSDWTPLVTQAGEAHHGVGLVGVMYIEDVGFRIQGLLPPGEVSDFELKMHYQALLTGALEYLWVPGVTRRTS